MTINTADYAIYAATQTARGVPAAAPTYALSVISGGLSGSPTVDELNVCEGSMWTPRYKRIGRIEAGGSPVFAAQPKDLALLLYAGMGNISTSGSADPYVHTITPATSPSGFPFLTFWQKLDTYWERFEDCQVTEFTLECSVADKFMRITPTIVGLERPKKVGAISSPPAAETDVYHWLDASGYWVIEGDIANLYSGAVPTDLDTAKTAATAIKAAYNLHCAVASGQHHKAADATNVVTVADASDETTLVALVNDIKAKLTAHMASTSVHYFADTKHAVTTADATDTATAIALLAELIGKTNAPGDYNGHLGAVANVNLFRLHLAMNAVAWQGEELTAYTIVRKKGTVDVAVNQLLEDMAIKSKIIYGDPAAAAETAMTDEIQTGSVAVKFIASTTAPERSLKIVVPRLDYNPASVAEITGNPDGNEIEIELGGTASGSGTLVTATVLNGVASY